MKPGQYTEQTTGNLVEITMGGQVIAVPTAVKPRTKWELSRQGLGSPLHLQEADTGKRLAWFSPESPEMEYVARWLVDCHNLVDSAPLEVQGTEEWLERNGFIEEQGANLPARRYFRCRPGGVYDVLVNVWTVPDTSPCVPRSVRGMRQTTVGLLQSDDRQTILPWIKTRGQLLMLIAQMRGLT